GGRLPSASGPDRSPAWVHRGSSLLCPLTRCLLNRGDDVLVAGTPAQVALESFAHLAIGGRGVLAQEGFCLHDHAGGAEAALKPVAVVERALQRMQFPVRGEPFDREHFTIVGLDS